MRRRHLTLARVSPRKPRQPPAWPLQMVKQQVLVLLAWQLQQVSVALVFRPWLPALVFLTWQQPVLPAEWVEAEVFSSVLVLVQQVPGFRRVQSSLPPLPVDG